MTLKAGIHMRFQASRGSGHLNPIGRTDLQPSSARREVLYQFLAAALCVTFIPSRPALAGAPSCSSAEAVSTVIGIEKDALSSIPFYAVFDFSSSDFSLTNIRTEGGNGYKFECAAKLVGDPQPKDLGQATAKNDAILRKMLSGSFTTGLPIRYSVEKTDDGKLYVELLNKSGG